MKPRCVWFNKHLSNTWEVIALLRDARRAGEFRVVCSHPRSSYATQLDCDHFEKEPIGLSDEEYIRYCLDFVQRHQVEFFFPGRKALPIVAASERFERVGAQIVAAARDAADLRRLQSKAQVYAGLKEEPIGLPDYEIMNDRAGFDAAWDRLRPRHDALCYKPDVSVYGIGFHVVADAATPRIAHGRPWRITPDDARSRLESKGRFRDHLVMQYLPGPERSVDCLARDGVLLRCAVRRKKDGGQMIEDHPEIVASVRRVTARLGLTNLFNVQFRDAGEKPFLLEINPRMSGGLPFACESGINFPLWAIRLALGTATPDEIPQPRVGVWVPQPEPVSSL